MEEGMMSLLLLEVSLPFVVAVVLIAVIVVIERRARDEGKETTDQQLIEK